MNTNSKAKYLFRGLLFAAIFLILGVYVGDNIPWGINFLQVFYYIIIGATFLTLVVYTLWDSDTRTNDDYITLLRGKFLPIKFPGRIIALMVLVILIHKSIIVGQSTAKLYNQSVMYYKQYDKATQGLDGLYDNFWKTYHAKKEITGMSKEAFIEVTKIVFEARKDGQSVSWKWLQENQPVPYGEFMSFYGDLSAYVETKRNEYLALENQRQWIAAAHNTLIDTFPNNLYNKLINRKHIDYKYGFLSDSTRQVFKSGNENP